MAPGRRCDCATARCNGRKSAQQNADKFRACARAPSASAAPPASGIAPLRGWRTVNVHPPCPVVNTLARLTIGLCENRSLAVCRQRRFQSSISSYAVPGETYRLAIACSIWSISTVASGICWKRKSAIA